MSEIPKIKTKSKISEWILDYDKNTYSDLQKKRDNKDILIDSFNECTDLRNSLHNSLDKIFNNLDFKNMKKIIKHDNSFTSLKFPNNEQRKILSYNGDYHLMKNNSVSKYDIKKQSLFSESNNYINPEKKYYITQHVQNENVDVDTYPNQLETNGQKTYELKMIKKITYNNNNEKDGNYGGEKRIEIFKEKVIESENEDSDEKKNMEKIKHVKNIKKGNNDKILNSIFNEIVKVKGNSVKDEDLEMPEEEMNNEYYVNSKTAITSRKEKVLNYEREKDKEVDESVRTSNTNNTNTNASYGLNSIRKSEKKEKEKRQIYKNRNIIQNGSEENPDEQNYFSGGKYSAKRYNKYQRYIKDKNQIENISLKRQNDNNNKQYEIEDEEQIDDNIKNIKFKRDINKNQIKNKIIYRKNKRFYNDEEDSKNHSKNSLVEVNEKRKIYKNSNDNDNNNDEENVKSINKKEKIIIFSSKDKNKDNGVKVNNIDKKDIKEIKEIKEVKDILVGQEKPINIKQNFDLEIKIDINENKAKKNKRRRIEVEAEQLKKDEDYEIKKYSYSNDNSEVEEEKASQKDKAVGVKVQKYEIKDFVYSDSGDENEQRPKKNSKSKTERVNNKKFNNKNISIEKFKNEQQNVKTNKKVNPNDNKNEEKKEKEDEKNIEKIYEKQIHDTDKNSKIKIIVNKITVEGEDDETVKDDEKDKERIEREKEKQRLRLELKKQNEQERLEKERKEKERLEWERLEKIRKENERIEKEKKERERLEKERQKELERLEKERIEKEKREKEEKERIEREIKEKVEREIKEKERIERERLEKEEKERERIEKERERIEKERLEKERQEKEKKEKERLEKERQEKEKERERKEKFDREMQKRLDKLERLEREMQERLEREKKERLEREKNDKLEKERKEKLEKERQERLEKEIQERLEREKQERQERLDRENQERQERLEREKNEKLEREKREKLEREKNEQLERERQAKFEKERLDNIEKDRQERLEREKRERLDRERQELEWQKKLENERIEREKELERERNEKEKRMEMERLDREEKERREREERLEKEERERKERIEKEERERRERIEKENKDRKERAKIEKERKDKEDRERKERLEKEEKERRERIEKEKKEREERDKIERERKEKERIEKIEIERKIRIERERIEKERREKSEKERKEREKNKIEPHKLDTKSTSYKSTNVNKSYNFTRREIKVENDKNKKPKDNQIIMKSRLEKTYKSQSNTVKNKTLRNNSEGNIITYQAQTIKIKPKILIEVEKDNNLYSGIMDSFNKDGNSSIVRNKSLMNIVKMNIEENKKETEKSKSKINEMKNVKYIEVYNTKKEKRSEENNLKCLYLMDYDELKDIESILNGKEIQKRIKNKYGIEKIHNKYSYNYYKTHQNQTNKKDNSKYRRRSAIDDEKKNGKKIVIQTNYSLKNISNKPIIQTEKTPENKYIRRAYKKEELYNTLPKKEIIKMNYKEYKPFEVSNKRSQQNIKIDKKPLEINNKFGNISTVYTSDKGRYIESKTKEYNTELVGKNKYQMKLYDKYKINTNSRDKENINGKKETVITKYTQSIKNIQSSYDNSSSTRFLNKTFDIERQKELLEKEKKEKEKKEKERLEKIRLEQREKERKEKLEKERKERERLEKEKRDKDRIERERIERERRLERERLEKERKEKEKMKEKTISKEIADKLRNKYYEYERKEEQKNDIIIEKQIEEDEEEEINDSQKKKSGIIQEKYIKKIQNEIEGIRKNNKEEQQSLEYPKKSGMRYEKEQKIITKLEKPDSFKSENETYFKVFKKEESSKISSKYTKSTSYDKPGKEVTQITIVKKEEYIPEDEDDDVENLKDKFREAVLNKSVRAKGYQKNINISLQRDGNSDGMYKDISMDNLNKSNDAKGTNMKIYKCVAWKKNNKNTSEDIIDSLKYYKNGSRGANKNSDNNSEDKS